MNYTAIAQWSQIVSAVLFVAALVWIWLKYLQPAVLSAQAATNAQIAEAERHRDAAKASLDALQGEIDSAHHDAELIESRAAAQAQAERTAALAEARDAGERALRNASLELDRSRAAARARLREDLVQQSLQEARAGAARRVDDAFDASLIDAFLHSLRGDSAQQAAE